MEILTITAGTILGMYLNMASATDNKMFAYNADMQDGKVSAIYTFDRCGHEKLAAKSKQTYDYDAQGRVVCKETLLWNAANGCWEKSTRLEYSYNDFGVTLEYSVWSRRDMAYSVPQQKVVYNMVADNVVSVDEYRWNEKQQGYELADGYLMMQDNMENLLASVK